MRDRYPLEAYPSGLLRIDDTNNRFTQVQRESRAHLLSRICHVHCHISLCVFPFLSTSPSSICVPLGSSCLFALLLSDGLGETSVFGAAHAPWVKVKERNLEPALSVRLYYDSLEVPSEKSN